ncbi:MAG: hypothetical protein ACK40P_12565, partial [Pseudanabaena sp.]
TSIKRMEKNNKKILNNTQQNVFKTFYLFGGPSAPATQLLKKLLCSTTKRMAFPFCVLKRVRDNLKRILLVQQKNFSQNPNVKALLSKAFTLSEPFYN